MRLALAKPPEPPGAPQDFELVTYGREGRFTHLDVGRTSALLEKDDLERYGGAALWVVARTSILTLLARAVRGPAARSSGTTRCRGRWPGPGGD